MSKNPSIFIADDDPDIIEILSMMLKTEGYDVKSTTNAEELFSPTLALPDLILLDLWMSGIDGQVICQKLKANEGTRHIPVLFLSANAQLSTITEKNNADGYIEKPFEMNFLLNKIAHFFPDRKK